MHWHSVFQSVSIVWGLPNHWWVTRRIFLDEHGAAENRFDNNNFPLRKKNELEQVVLTWYDYYLRDVGAGGVSLELGGI